MSASKIKVNRHFPATVLTASGSMGIISAITAPQMFFIKMYFYYSIE